MSESELAEDFLPGYDVSDAVARVVEADREVTWQALLDVDLLKLGCSAPLVGMLGALRMLPEVVGHLLHRERPAKPPDSMRLRDLPSMPMYEGGWILLRERPGEEIALGLVGKFWRPVAPHGRRPCQDTSPPTARGGASVRDDARWVGRSRRDRRGKHRRRPPVPASLFSGPRRWRCSARPRRGWTRL